VYQSPQGGPTYGPLDRDARIVVSSTPRFAKVLSQKYAELSSPRAQVDLKENHGRSISRCLIQDVADAVAAAVLAKEEDWGYTLPKFEEPPSTVTVSLDGTCLLMVEDGWRETMVGTLSFYDREGERQHTIYLAATPEYGKAKFLSHLEAEIDRAKARCPDAHYVGIGDGAKGNWEFLQRHTDVQVTDFWHAAEYLGKAAMVLYRGRPQTRKTWLDDACHRLKHEPGGAAWVLKRLRTMARERPWAQGRRGRAIRDHVLCKPVEGGANGLRRTSDCDGADRQWRDGGSVQGDRQAAVVRFRNEVDRGWGGRGTEPACVELHIGAVGSVLVEGRSLGLPRRSLSRDAKLKDTSILGRTPWTPSRRSLEIPGVRGFLRRNSGRPSSRLAFPCPRGWKT
jgi:hypothetical protein